MVRLPEPERNRAIHNFRLAEQLGAETLTLRGRRIAEELVDFARRRNIIKIVAGKPIRLRWKDILFGSPVDELVRLSGEIDVYVIRGEPGEAKGSLSPAPGGPFAGFSSLPWKPRVSSCWRLPPGPRPLPWRPAIIPI